MIQEFDVGIFYQDSDPKDMDTDRKVHITMVGNRQVIEKLYELIKNRWVMVNNTLKSSGFLMDVKICNIL